MFNGSKETTVDGLLNGWRSYFTDLYRFTENPEFDENQKFFIEEKVISLLDPRDDQNVSGESRCNILHETCATEIQSLLKGLPNNKSASIDNITYEHLKFGGPALVTSVVRLFNAIIEHEQIPESFKTGLTVTLYKGNGKSYSDPSSYRAISLLPVISKLF